MKNKRFKLFFILFMSLLLISPYNVFAAIKDSSENELNEEEALKDETNNSQDEGNDQSETAKEGEEKSESEETKSKSDKDIDSLNENKSKTSQPKVLKKGTDQDAVKELKENLEKLGFMVSGKLTSHFDDETEEKVKEFQEYYGLDVTGEADDATLTRIDEILSSPFQSGKSHEDTIQLKEDLASLGYKVSEDQTDYYDEETTKQVEEFQSDHELVVSGIAEEVTQAKIQELLEQSPADDTDGIDVVMLKENLRKLGFEVSEDDTPIFDSETEGKVKEFQEYYGLDVTGKADDTTLEKIDEILSSPFQTGKRHDDTTQLKKDLATIGYRVPGNGTNLYGKKTAEKVKELQSDHGLAESGIAEEVTQAKIQELLEQPLSNGAYDSDVVTLKENLKKLGFKISGNTTPLFGDKTEKKVKEFQGYYGLDVTGEADDATLEKIDEILASPFQTGKRHKDTIQLKKDLATIGYRVPGNGTNLYGKKTAEKVKELQSDHELAASGIVDKMTQAKIQELLEQPLSNGAYDSKVVTLKENLKKIGFEVSGNSTPLFGDKTEKKVKELQKYYGLDVTAEADNATLAKIDEILSSPFQSGKRHKDTIQLKKDLETLGYPVPGDGTNYYGKGTIKKVKELQSSYGLVVNGIVDEPTADKIDDLLSKVLDYGDRNESVIQLKEDLKTLGFEVPGNGTNYFGKQTEKKVKELQTYYDLTATGVADAVTLTKMEEILSSPLQTGKRHKDTVQLKKDLAMLGYQVPGNGTDLYGKQTAKKVKEFQKNNDLAVSGIADEVTLAKINEVLEDLNYSSYDLTLDQAVSIQMKANPQTDKNYGYVSKKYIDKNDRVKSEGLNVRKGAGTPYKVIGTLTKGKKVKVISEHKGWYVIEYNGTDQWVNARPEDVKYYLDPSNFIHDEKQQFQFLDLSVGSGVSKTKLNNYLKGKGILEGRGKAFIDAGKQNGINDIYLISHALLETGNGTSALAKGIEVGKNKSGNLVLVTSSNRSSLKNIKKVYNMYGIGAYDNCAKECGAKRAYKEGWTTPDKAIIGGAKFIDNYVNRGQNTLYKMRWDPAAMDSTGAYGKQYATDIGWASKQINTMYNLYKSIGDYELQLDIPDYK